MDRANNGARKQRRSRPSTRLVVVSLTAAVFLAALTHAATRHNPLASTAAPTPPLRPSLPLLSPAAVEAGLPARFQKMEARFDDAEQRRLARGNVVVLPLPTPQPLPRDLVLPVQAAPQPL